MSRRTPRSRMTKIGRRPAGEHGIAWPMILISRFRTFILFANPAAIALLIMLPMGVGLATLAMWAARSL